MLQVPTFTSIFTAISNRSNVLGHPVLALSRFKNLIRHFGDKCPMLYAEPWSILKTSKCCVLLNILYKKALDCWYIIVKIEEKNTGQRSAQQVKQLWWEDGDGEAMGSRMLWRLAAPPHRQSASTAPPGSIISDYYIIPTSYHGRCGRQIQNSVLKIGQLTLFARVETEKLFWTMIFFFL